MYGTIFRMRPLPGHEKDLVDLTRTWLEERRPKIDGFVANYVLRPDNRPGELTGVAIFASREAYMANADDPEQDAWYRQLRAHLAADPEWEDGEIVLAG